ncbi:unnamed protein product [Ectocarpus fasciculatus]
MRDICWWCCCNLPFMLLVLLPWIEGAAAEDERAPPHGGSRRFHDPKATLYEILGVSKHSSRKEIKRVYHEVALVMHPDKRGTFANDEATSEANDIFVKIKQAYETLYDPILRQQYDLTGMKEGVNSMPAEEEPEERYEDAPFGMFVRFGGGRGGLWFRYKGHGKRRAPDLMVALPVTFEEAFEGKTANVTVARERLCRTCGGTGASEPGEMPTCNLCEGKGYAYHLFGVHESDTQNGHNSRGDRHHHHDDASGGNPRGRCSEHVDGRRDGVAHGGGGDGLPGYAHAVNTTCKVCSGTGKVSDGGCPDCRGRKVKVETETFEVTLPAGVLPGHAVNLAGKGTEHPDKLAGSIHVVAVQVAHPRFERLGADLIYRKKISLIDALLGFERMLTLLDGTRVPIVHDQVTLSGYQQELPGLGFPVVGGDGERGSLVIDFEVDFPSRLREAHLAALRVVLTEEEIALLEDVLKLMSTRKSEARPPMEPLEYVYTRTCSNDDEDDDINKGSNPRCIMDLLWWARPQLTDDDGDDYESYEEFR